MWQGSPAKAGVWKETGEHWGLGGREKGCPRKEAGETDYHRGMQREADVFHLLGDRGWETGGPVLWPCASKGGWTAELGEAASDFGGWEEGEMAETPSEPGLMQPEARLWSKVSIAWLVGGEGGKLHIPERKARWQCGRDGVPSSLPPRPPAPLGGPLSLTDATEPKSPSVSTFPSRRPAAGQRSRSQRGGGRWRLWGNRA